MKKEDMNLLLKDLCARLPYFTKVQIKNEIVVLDSICDDDGYHFNFIGEDREGVNIEEIKPYLFPLSSMTEEQTKELENLGWNFDNFEINNINECFGTYREYVAHLDCFVLIDWLNKNYFDYRGLIEKGLAFDATGLRIYE